MKFSELKKHLNAGVLAPCYILEGRDRYLINYSIKLFSQKAEFPELNVNHFDDSSDPSEIVRACTVVPMMSDYRVILLTVNKSLPAEVIKYLETPAAETLLVLVPKTKLTGAAVKDAQTVDCNPLDEELLKSWIAKESGGNISKPATGLLIEYTMGDLGRISTELEKLTHYCSGKMIQSGDVEAVVSKDAEYKIYSFLQELTSKHADRAYAMLAAMGTDAPPLKMVFSLYSHFHKLLYVLVSRAGEAEIAESFHVKPYALKYIREQARAFKAVQLKEILDYIADCDYRIKTGALKDSAALDNIMLKVLSL